MVFNITIHGYGFAISEPIYDIEECLHTVTERLKTQSHLIFDVTLTWADTIFIVDIIFKDEAPETIFISSTFTQEQLDYLSINLQNVVGMIEIEQELHQIGFDGGQ